MEPSVEKLVTYNIKKDNRFQSKKRKLEALLNLFQEEDKTGLMQKKKKSCSLQEDYKVLKDKLKVYMKKPEVTPSFYLTEIGEKSQVKLKTNKSFKCVKPLFTEDIYHLILRSVVGHMSPYSFKWAKLEQPQNICRTVLLVIEGLPNHIIHENKSNLSNITDIFINIVEIASPNLSFPRELTYMHEITHFHIENKDTFSSMFPSKKVVKVKPLEDSKKLSKLHLLLSPIQLVMENYPLPNSVFQYSKSLNYSFTKDSYAPVTADSPIFAVDCEMCRTEKSSNELSRIAVINEKHEVVYESLVKPKTKIIDYMTKYSGITKTMLSGVKTRLEDVQKELRTILPQDAILCGQSLNCDLHALKMMHPYVIDTSIIFNDSGIRGKKDSLKYLSKVYLNEDIQNNKKGHNPIEDALASIKLVQLKLDNSIQFGDVCFSENNNPNNPQNEISNGVSNIDEDITFNSKETNISQKVNTTEKTDGFFALTSKYNKKVCLIGCNETLDMYGELSSGSIQKKIKSCDKKVLKATLKHMENFDLTISHLNFSSISESSSMISELNKIVKIVFDCCSNQTMFMMLTCGVNQTSFEDIRSGMFMATIKKIDPVV